MDYKLPASSTPVAIRAAKALCRCRRESFDGVRWYDTDLKEWRSMTWQQVDLSRLPPVATRRR